MAVQLGKHVITKRALIHPKRGKTMPPKLPRLDMKKVKKVQLMRVIPIIPKQKQRSGYNSPQQQPKPTDRPTFIEYLLLALANGKE